MIHLNFQFPLSYQKAQYKHAYFPGRRRTNDTPNPLSNAFLIKLDSCTGTLIADDWVITAAHCYSTLPKLKKYKNEFGDYEVINDAWSKF